MELTTGERLRVARQRNGLSLRAAVEAASEIAEAHGLQLLGLNTGSLGRYERGISDPGTDLVRVLARTYGMAVVELAPDLPELPTDGARLNAKQAPLDVARDS